MASAFISRILDSFKQSFFNRNNLDRFLRQMLSKKHTSVILLLYSTTKKLLKCYKDTKITELAPTHMVIKLMSIW